MSRDEKVNISLTCDEYDVLLVMCGYATGAALTQNNKKLGYSFLALANAINRDNPHWTPYEIPYEEPQA